MTGRFLTITVLALMWLPLRPVVCPAQDEPVREDFDHIIYLTIESEPPGATVYSIT